MVIGKGFNMFVMATFESKRRLTSLTRQMRQFSGGDASGTSYCVPHTSQMARSPDSNFMIEILLFDQ